MKHELKEISQTEKELIITIDADEALTDYKAVLNQFKKYVAIPGFRKGKAPVAKVEKMYGEYAIEQFYDDKLGKYYKAALDEIDVNPINAGEATNVDWKKGDDLVATFRFEIMPRIEIKKYENLEIAFESTKFDEKLIDSTIEDFQDKMATTKEIEGEDKISKGDTVNANLGFLDENNKVTKEITRTFVVDDNVYCKSFNNKVKESKIGDQFNSIIFTKSTKVEDDEIGEKFRGKDFQITIKSASIKELPEINDDFAKDLGYDSIIQLREKIGAELKKKIEDEDKDKLRSAIISKLIVENQFEMPKSLVSKYAEDMAKPYAEAYKMDIETLIPMYTQLADFNMKSHYLMEELKKVCNIKFSDEDKTSYIAEEAKIAGIDVEKYAEINKSQLESSDFIYMREEDKVLDLIKKTATFVPYPKEEIQEEK